MGGERAPIIRFLVFTAFCLVFAYWLIVTLGNISPGADRVSYSARFDDVTGLLVDDNVKISGVTVGKVRAIEVDDGGAALVRFSLDETVEVPEDSTVEIRWRDTFGLRFLYVNPGKSDVLVDTRDDAVDFPNDQTIAPTSIGTFLGRITPFIEALDPSLQNQVLQALQQSIVGREQEIRDLISDGGDLTQALASRDETLGRLLDNSATILDEYAQRDEDIRALVDSLVSITETLARRNESLDTAVTALADLQDETGTLIERNEDDLRATLDALEVTAETLAVNREQLDTTLTRLPNVVVYHRVSRLGQWFNVRAVGTSADYRRIDSERGARLPDRRDGDGGSNASSMFEAPLGMREGR